MKRDKLIEIISKWERLNEYCYDEIEELAITILDSIKDEGGSDDKR